MADLTITAASVLYTSGPKVSSYNAGAAVTAGQGVYLDSTTSTLKLAQSDGTARGRHRPAADVCRNRRRHQYRCDYGENHDVRSGHYCGRRCSAGGSHQRQQDCAAWPCHCHGWLVHRGYPQRRRNGLVDAFWH
jgi:hypothetical protein